jgi:hypothetical protein
MMTASLRTDSGGDRGDGGPSDRLVELAYELLDAGTDTLELLDYPADLVVAGVEPMSFSWASHVDYLRALHRRGREILAAEVVGSPRC